MNRDTIIGFVLIAVVLIGFSWWNQPSAEQVEAARKQDSIAAIQKDSAQKAVQQAAAQKAVADSSVAVQADTTALFYQALQGTAKKVVLKNGKLTLTLNTKGGTIEKAVIHGFQSIDGTNDVTLFRENDQQLNFMLAGKQENIVSSEGQQWWTFCHQLPSGQGLHAEHGRRDTRSGRHVCTSIQGDGH